MTCEVEHGVFTHLWLERGHLSTTCSGSAHLFRNGVSGMGNPAWNAWRPLRTYRKAPLLGHSAGLYVLPSGPTTAEVAITSVPAGKEIVNGKCGQRQQPTLGTSKAFNTYSPAE